jgi:hypothetical protein
MFAQNGYSCFPADGGFCYLGCDPTKNNTHGAENMGKSASQVLDSRCNDLPGYVCYGYNGGGLCLKGCDQSVTDPAQCSAPATVNGNPQDLGQSQICQDFGIQVCTWPDTYTPS